MEKLLHPLKCTECGKTEHVTIDSIYDDCIICERCKEMSISGSEGIEASKAGRKLRKIMNKKIALIESSHDDRQPKDPVKHYDPINKKFLYFSY